MDPDISKWPLLYQVLAGIGALATGAWMWLRGAKVKPAIQSAGGSDAELRAALQEIARLRDERQQDRDEQQQERDQEIALELKAIRADFEMVLKALKESMYSEFRDIKHELGQIDKRLAVLEDRWTRRR